MIFVIATLRTSGTDRNALIEASSSCIAETRKEAGCLSYDLHMSVSDPDTLVFVERWQDRQALESHFRSPHLTAWKDTVAPLIVDKSVEIITPEAVDGL